MAKGFTKKDISKQDFLVLRQSRDGSITNVIAPNGLQVGLTDDRFSADLKVKGVIQASQGVSGSLTKLHDGTDYLRAAAGGNITLLTGSDGSITISAASSTIDINGLSSSLTDSTLAALDLFAVHDANAGSVKKITLDDVVEFIRGGTSYGGSGLHEDGGQLYLDIDGLTAATVNVATDFIAFSDADSTNDATYKESIADFVSGIAGTVTATGLDSDSGTLVVDIKGQSSTSAHVSDQVLIWDVSTWSLKKTTVGSIQNAGQQVDIAGLSNSLTESTLATTDLLIVNDTSNSNTVKKITIEDFGQYLAAGSASGIGESSGQLTIDLNNLSAGVVVPGSDSIAIIDADDNASKKESITDFVEKIRGVATTTGLSSTSGVLNIDITNQSTLTLHDDDQLLVWDDDASALKKTTVSALNSSIPLGSLSVEAPSASADSIAFIDASDSNASKKVTIANFASAVAGDGLGTSSGQLTVDLQELTEAAVAVGTDYMAFIDGGASGTSKKESIADFVSGIAGTGISASSGQLSLDIGSGSGQAAAGNNSITVTAGDGLKSGGSLSIGQGGTVQLDIKVSDFAGNGLSTSSDDLIIDNTVVATLSGSTFSGVASFDSGLSGSLTTLTDGTPYLIGSSTIQLSTGSSGAITFTATAAGGLDVGTITGVTAGTGLSGGGSAGAVTLNIDHSEFALLNETPADTDYILVVDTTADAIKRVLVTDLPGDIEGVVAGTGLSGGGTTGTVTLAVDLSELSSASPSPGADQFVFIDANDSDTTKRGSMAEFVTETASTGLSATNGALSIDDSIVATISGSVFSGHVGVTGSIEATSSVSGSLFKAPALTGSLTTLHDGSSYLVAGSGISIVTGSSGQVTITGNVGDITGVTAGAGLSGGGSSGDVTLTIDNSILATLSGSQFSGNVGITGSLGVTGGISGSLTHLSDGSSYLIAGTNVTVVTSSSGAVTISSSHSDTTYTAGTGLDLSGTSFSVDNTVTATLTGSTFSGTVSAPSLSGSLTKLNDGSSYLIAGSNISIATGSSGAVTITSTDTNTTYSSSDFTHDDLTGFVANEHIDWTSASAGTIHATNYTNTEYTVGDGGLTQNNFTNALKNKLDGIAASATNTVDLTVSGAGTVHADNYTDTNTTYTAGTGLELDTTEFSVDNSIIATLSGSVFSGHVGVTGSIHSTTTVSGSILKAPALSGSLTHLEDGSSYIIAGANVTIATGSAGAITISSTDTNTTYSSSDFDHDQLTNFVANEHIDWTQASAGTIHATNYTDTNTEYTAGNGLDLSSTEFALDLKSGSGLVITSTELDIDNSVIATLSGSVFSGHVGVTGSVHSTAEISGSIVKASALSGSLTHLENGNSYLVAGSNVTIVTGSTGAITISSTDTNTNTTYTAGTGLDLTGTEFSVDSSLFALRSGTTFSGDVEFTQDVTISGTLNVYEIKSTLVSSSIIFKSGSTKFGNTTDDLHQFTGSASFKNGLSGSITHLPDGSSYLIAGTNVTIATGSTGAITISSTDTNTTYSSSDFTHDDLQGFVANEHIDWTASSAGTIHSSNYSNTTYTAGNGLDLSSTEFSLDLKADSGLVITSSELDVDNSVIATLSGSVFSGHVGVTGSIHSTAEVSGSILKASKISGSLTHLEDGSSYLVAGSNVTIATGSTGAITISSADTNTVYTAGTGLDLAGTEFSLSNTISALAISGSLTKLVGGKSYLVAGSNVSIVTGSTGQVTISATDTNTTYSSSDFDHDQLTNFVANEHIDWTQSSAGTIHSSNYTDTNTEYTAGHGLDLSSTEFSLDLKSGSGLVIDSTELSVDNSVIATLSGSVFSGHVGVTGSIHSTSTVSGSIIKSPVLTGSLTHLEDGSSYLIAGSNVTIATGSTGAITISSADTNTTYSSSDFTHDDLQGFVANEHIDWTQASAGTIHATNYTNTEYTVGDGGLTQNNFTNALKTKLDGIAASATNTVDLTVSGAGTVHADNYTDTNTTYTSGTGLSLTGTQFSVDNSVIATLSGSVFSGHVGVTGSIHSTSTVSGSIIKAPVLSGSLTHLEDGSSYIIAGSNVTIATGSTGAITISSADTNTTYSSSDFTHDDLSGFVANEHIDWTQASAGTIHATNYTDTNTTYTAGTGLDLAGTEFSLSNNLQAVALTGSLTKLVTGKSYLVAGSNVTIVTGSTGQVTISSVDTDTNYTAGTGLNLSSTEFSVDPSVVALRTGTTFTGDVVVSGTLTATEIKTTFVSSSIVYESGSTKFGDTANDVHQFTGSAKFKTGLSGSLTHLPDGSSFLIAGTNVTIATGSAGAITISAQLEAGDGDITGVTAGTGLSGGATSGNATLAIDNSVVATLTGSVFSGHVGVTGSIHSTAEISGSLVKASVLSGSLTHLENGSSYLIAGSNVTITTGSSGAVTIASTASGTAVVSGSTSVSNVSSINFDNFGLVQDLGSNQIAVTGSIGPAEDGSYSAGLFSDFTPNTTVGTAIDRFNEVLKGLAPAAAPTLDDAACSDSGTAAKLSFGSSKSVSGYTNVASSGLSPTDNLSNIDINGAFSSTSASNDLRVACFAGATVINGTLNDDISADGVNYAADSFGNGEQGTLKLYVNDNSNEIHSVNLASFGSGNSLNGDGSGFNLSAATPGHFSDNSNFDTFQHRQGTYIITAASQRNGWNYARVTHTVGSSTNTTNYIEWVNDSDNNALAAAGSAMDTLSMTGTKNLSGVKYNTGGTAQYRIRVTNAYKNVYSTSNITFSETNCSIPNQSFPAINHGAGEDEDKVLHLTGSATITGDPILNGSISASTNVPHPLKSNLSSAGSQSISGILLYNLSDTSSITSETFRGESYRLVSGSYANQAAVTAGGAAWDSTTSLSTVDGLLYYNSRLYAPSQGGASGDFRNTSDGGSITNGPSSNVNYSSITSGTRTFYRKFQNNSGGSKTGFNLTINGSGTIVSHGTAFNSSRIKVFVKLPETASSFETGFMDLATAFATGQVSDSHGCLAGSLDSSLNATNEVTFGTQSIGDDEWVVVIIKTDASFTGYISSMSVSWS